MSGARPSPYANAVGGKLRLKGVDVGTKRPRADAPLPLRAAAAAVAAAAAAPADDTIATAGAPLTVDGGGGERVEGTGRIITSGSTLHGVDTRFLKEFQAGDAIEVTNPTTHKEEIRVVKMVLSDKSAGINAPFSADLVSATAFMVLRLPRQKRDAQTVAAEAEKAARDSERNAFGTFASEGGTVLTYRVKKAGVYGGYKIENQKLDGAASRTDLLDMRAKKSADKHCH